MTTEQTTEQTQEVAPRYSYDQVAEAIQNNGGQISELQIKLIADQINKGTVPHNFICITTGAVKGCSSAELRAKRLNDQPGEDAGEQLFNLLTSYKSIAGGGKPRHGERAKRPSNYETTGTNLESFLGLNVVGDETPIVYGEMIVYTGNDRKFKKIKFDGNNVNISEFDNPLETPTENTETVPAPKASKKSKKASKE